MGPLRCKVAPRVPLLARRTSQEMESASENLGHKSVAGKFAEDDDVAGQVRPPAGGPTDGGREAAVRRLRLITRMRRGRLEEVCSNEQKVAKEAKWNRRSQRSQRGQKHCDLPQEPWARAREHNALE